MVKLVCYLIIVIAGFCFSMPGIYAQNSGSEFVEQPSWFTLAQTTAENWKMEYDSNLPSMFRLTQLRDYENEEAYSIFVLFPKRSSAYDTAMERITSVLYNQYVNAQITAENFEGDDRQGFAILEEMGDYDLMFTMGSVSTEFVYGNLELVSIPVVSVTSKDPVMLGQISDYDQGSGSNMAFTSLNIPLDVQTAYMYELKPNLKNIGVMYARNNKSAVDTQVIPLYDMAVRRGIQLVEVVVEDQSNAREELSAKIPQALITMKTVDPELDDSIFWITGSTSVFREIATINKHSGIVPVLSVVSDVVKEGSDSAAMSIGVSFESNAHVAVLYAIDILRGEIEAGELKVGIVSPPDVSINFMKTREIGLKVPFSFFELASVVYGSDGRLARFNGEAISLR